MAESYRESATRDLERVARRWQQLPVSHALQAVPVVQHLVQSLADEAATATGVRQHQVPDLGPAVVIDQLRVMVSDYREAHLSEEALAHRLADVRRALP